MDTVKNPSWAEWQLLPKETQALFIAIGFKEPKEPLVHKAKREPLSKLERDRRAFLRTTCPDEYSVQIIESCLCCGTKHKRQFLMIRNGEKNALESRECCLLHEPDRKRTVDTFSCASCRSLLMEKPKQELVSMILALNDQLRYSWPDDSRYPECELTD
jgi:hypothetical protein